MLPHGCPSQRQFAWVQVMRRLSLFDVADVHSRHVVQLPVGDSDATGNWQLGTWPALPPAPLPLPLLLGSLIKLGRSDCHWEIARLQLSYSLCENSFTLARFSFFFMPAQMPYISASLHLSSPAVQPIILAIHS